MSSKTALTLVFALYWLLGMHLFMHNGGGSGLYLPFNAWGWMFGSLVLGLGLWHGAGQQALKFSALQAGLWTGALLLFLPMFYPGFEWKARALPRLLGLVAGLLFLLCLYQWSWTRRERDRLLYLLLGGVAIEAAMGLVQYHLLTPGNWIGYDTQANRPYGIFQQPNVMATFLSTGLALAVWLELRRDEQPWLRGLRYFVVVSSGLLLVALQSRVGQLGALMALALLTPQLVRQRMLLRVLVLVGAGVVLGLLPQWGLLPAGPVGGTQRGMEIYQSAGVRWPIWTYGFKLIAQSPWIGWGYGGFEATMLHHYMADRALNPAMPMLTPNLDHPHNELIYWGIEGGLLALVGLFVMAGTVLWRLSQTSWTQASALLALITPIALHTQTEYPLYHAVALWWALLLLVHVIDADVQALRQGQGGWQAHSHRSQWLMRSLAVLIPLVLLPFMLTTLHTAWLVTQVQRGQAQSMDRLNDIINPLPWMGRLELVLNLFNVQGALAVKDKEGLTAFVHWGQAFVRHTPRNLVYSHLVLALEALDRKDEALAVKQTQQMLYPPTPQP